ATPAPIITVVPASDTLLSPFIANPYRPVSLDSLIDSQRGFCRSFQHGTVTNIETGEMQRTRQTRAIQLTVSQLGIRMRTYPFNSINLSFPAADNNRLRPYFTFDEVIFFKL